MKIAVVILNWNGKQLLERFLPYVIKYSDLADIYVVDNASSDDSVAYILDNFSKIKIIKNSVNGGYAHGYNEGLKKVDADYYCLLNNDVEVTKGWLDPIIKLFKTQPNTAIIQPKLLDLQNKDYFEYAGAAGGFIDKYAYPFCRGRIFNTIEKDLGQYNDVSEIFWASGACFFIRKSVFEELGGFDESFFAHMEEIDLCWRAKNLGYSIKYTFESKIYHLGGATLSNQNPKKTYLNFKNSLLTLVKNKKENIFFTLLIRLILDGLAGIMFLFQLKPLHTLAIIKAHIRFYSIFPKAFKQRNIDVSTEKYYKIGSIIWSYFIKNIKAYKNL